MPVYAPLRELAARLLAVHHYAGKHLALARRPSGLALLLESFQPRSSPLAGVSEAGASFGAEILKFIDDTTKQARRLTRTLRGVVPHPADEQSRIVMFIASVRGAIQGGRPLPPSDDLIRHVGRLWTLADAIQEPLEFELVPEAGGAAPRKQRKPAITGDQVARALVAIQEGRVNSTRTVATLIVTSQSAVARHPVIREALKAISQEPRHRGYRVRGGGIEAIEDGS